VHSVVEQEDQGRDAVDNGSSLEPSAREAWRITAVLWAVAAVFGMIAVARSQQVGIPFRDPSGQMFRGRLLSAVELLVVLALVDGVVRGLWGHRALRGSFRAVADAFRERWTLRRIGLVASGLLAYHVVYISYRNLKSWDAFNAPRDQDLLDLDRALFLGHSPAVLLHDLFGTGTAAVVLADVYRSFTYLVVISVVGTLALLPRVREAYVMLVAGVWVWILGITSYYLVPTLGPFASAPSEFAGLRHTAITDSQVKYLAERAHLLAAPQASDSFASISAFASLHVAFTTTIFLVAVYYRWRKTAVALGLYVLAVMVSTVYFGWHFVLDDIAGVVIAVLAVTLARLMVHGRRMRGRERTGEA
jgi:membrane-associated phospholipid phosphatase